MSTRCPPDVRRQVEGLAREAGLDATGFDRPVADGGVALRHRVRLARALAISPAVLLIEHPMAGLDAHEIGPLAGDITRVGRDTRRRGDRAGRGRLDRDALCGEGAYAEWGNRGTDGDEGSRMSSDGSRRLMNGSIRLIGLIRLIEPGWSATRTNQVQPA